MNSRLTHPIGNELTNLSKQLFSSFIMCLNTLQAVELLNKIEDVPDNAEKDVVKFLILFYEAALSKFTKW